MVCARRRPAAVRFCRPADRVQGRPRPLARVFDVEAAHVDTWRRRRSGAGFGRGSKSSSWRQRTRLEFKRYLLRVLNFAECESGYRNAEQPHGCSHGEEGFQQFGRHVLKFTTAADRAGQRSAPRDQFEVRKLHLESHRPAPCALVLAMSPTPPTAAFASETSVPACGHSSPIRQLGLLICCGRNAGASSPLTSVTFSHEATALESEMFRQIQHVFGQALKTCCPHSYAER